jgi:hypothetical protein
LAGLSPFTQQQVQELTVRYGLTPPETYASELVKLVGGNPYLTQLALFHLSQNNVTLNELLETGTTPDSMFESHLRRQLGYLEQNSELQEAMQQVVVTPNGVEFHPTKAFKLQGVGLIRFQNRFALPICELYQTYFASIFELLNKPP